MLKIIVSIFLITTINFANAGDPERGEVISIGCRGCHGVRGIATQLMHPNLAGQKEKYLIWQLSNFKSGKRPSHIMNEIASGLSEDDIRDLSAYYSILIPECD